MTTVTAVITHKLFGRGRQWRGKLIRDNWTGINRFSGDQGSIEMAHEFQFQIGPSKLDGSPSLKHDYAPFHQFILSPWSSMKDELRWVKCTSGKVMIGIGYFGWSGGVLNSSPFLLYKLS
ncbi:hypothetical protein MHU86_16599 [Fragilaria crotonensis]|nr:hypothetical protein MHU86_16599 [Fragilaria crotonensis]